MLGYLLQTSCHLDQVWTRVLTTHHCLPQSRVDVITIHPRDDKKSIYLEWRLEAFLNVPGFRWAQIKPYTGSTICEQPHCFILLLAGCLLCALCCKLPRLACS